MGYWLKLVFFLAVKKPRLSVASLTLVSFIGLLRKTISWLFRCTEMDLPIINGDIQSAAAS